MTVGALAAIGVLSALWSWQRVKRIAQLPLRHMWVAWSALLTQLIVFQWVSPYLSDRVLTAIHLATYGLVVAFIVLNRHLPGALLIAAGTACNLTVIIANGGTMPIDPDAWARAGRQPIPPEVFKNSRALSNPRLPFLGDIFPIPAELPLSNVLSIGDLLIVAGGTYLAHRWCASADSSESRVRPEPVPATP